MTLEDAGATAVAPTADNPAPQGLGNPQASQLADPATAQTPPLETAGQPPVETSGTYDPSQYVLYAKADLSPWQGRSGEMRKDAVFGQQAKSQRVDEMLTFLSQQDLTIGEVLDNWQKPVKPEAGAAIENRTGEESPLTREAMLQMFDERDEKMRVESEAKEASRTEQEARDAEAQFGGQVLQEIGIKPDSANWKFGGEIFSRCIIDALDESVPEWTNDEQRRAITSGPSTPQIRARAKELFVKAWTDFQNETIAAYASGQSTIPATTLAGGAGGRPPAKQWEEMTHEERLKAMKGEPV